MKFTQCPAKSEPQPNGGFEYYNGMISGTYLSLEENKKLEMNWKMKDWPTSSHVIIIFDQSGDVSSKCESIWIN